MSRIVIPHQALILVCDGAKSVFFENAGDNQALNLKPLETHLLPLSPTREMGSERPTRVYESVGALRSGADEDDLHARAEADFLRRMAETLENMVVARDTHELVIVAPPRALGAIRAFLGPASRRALTSELNRDLVRHPTAEIERHLAALTMLS